MHQPRSMSYVSPHSLGIPHPQAICALPHGRLPAGSIPFTPEPTRLFQPFATWPIHHSTAGHSRDRK
jgi:hypothetical protein